MTNATDNTTHPDRKCDVKVVMEWDLALAQEQLDNLCEIGYTLHTVTTIQNRVVFTMVRYYE